MTEELNPGDRVAVTLLKSGYWKGVVIGNVVRVNGDRVTVASRRRAITFSHQYILPCLTVSGCR